MRGLIITSVILLGIASVVIYEIRKIQQISAKLISKRIISAGSTRVIMELILEVNNDSDIDIDIQGYDLDLSINGNFITKVKQNITQVIAAKGKSQFSLLLDFNPSQVLGQALNLDFIASLLKSKTNIVIGLNGYVSILGVKNLQVNQTIPINQI